MSRELCIVGIWDVTIACANDIDMGAIYKELLISSGDMLHSEEIFPWGSVCGDREVYLVTLYLLANVMPSVPMYMKNENERKDDRNRKVYVQTSFDKKSTNQSWALCCVQQ